MRNWCKKVKGNVVSDSEIILYSDRWLLDLLWRTHSKVYKCKITVLRLKLMLYADFTFI